MSLTLMLSASWFSVSGLSSEIPVPPLYTACNQSLSWMLRTLMREHSSEAYASLPQRTFLKLNKTKHTRLNRYTYYPLIFACTTLYCLTMMIGAAWNCAFANGTNISLYLSTRHAANARSVLYSSLNSWTSRCLASLAGARRRPD